MTQSLVIGIEPTRQCNLRCKHCLRADTSLREEMPLDLFAKILAQAKIYHHPHFAFTGGEPTLHPQIVEMIALVEANEMTCHLVTNGQRFVDLLPELMRYRRAMRTVSFSLDGATEETHDAIRGKGTHRRVLLAMGLATYKGFATTAQLVVNRRNRHEISKMPALCHALGVKNLYVSHAQPTPELYAAGWQLTPEESHEVEREVMELARTTKGTRPWMSVGHYNPGVLAPCRTLQHRIINIDYRGRLTFCCQLSGVGNQTVRTDIVANLNETSLATAHRNVNALVHDVINERLRAQEKGTFGDLDGFQCWYCQKRFGTLDWMRDYPKDPWVAQDPTLHQLTLEKRRRLRQLRRRRAKGV